MENELYKKTRKGSFEKKNANCPKSSFQCFQNSSYSSDFRATYKVLVENNEIQLSSKDLKVLLFIF